MPGEGGGGDQQGQGGGSGGGGAGSEHDANLFDDSTSLDSSRRNSRVEGTQSDEGPSRSEVIVGAAQRGFAGRDYEQVYTDYENHAEDVLERDEVPAGRRFYIRRYFQLIRPRDGAPPAPPAPE